MKRFAWLLVTILLVCIILPCRGAKADNPLEDDGELELELVKKTVYPMIDAKTIKEIMEKEGFAVSIQSKRTVLWKLDGYKIYITVYKDDESVSFSVTFNSKETTLEEVNLFNKKYRYAKAYMPQAGIVKMETDFNFKGGVTKENFIVFCNTYKDLFQKWRQTVL